MQPNGNLLLYKTNHSMALLIFLLLEWRGTWRNFTWKLGLILEYLYSEMLYYKILGTFNIFSYSFFFENEWFLKKYLFHVQLRSIFETFTSWKPSYLLNFVRLIIKTCFSVNCYSHLISDCFPGIILENRHLSFIHRHIITSSLDKSDSFI